jgi:tRNA pseudouridine65 synthase
MEIIFRDEYLVAVHKPAGLLVHRSAIAAAETDFALQQLRNMLGQHVYPIHRLDKPTSGVLLFALSPAVARQMGEQFQSHAVRKCYVAIVRGYTAQQGTIDHPLRRIIDSYGKPIQKTDELQEAQTHYRRLATLELAVSLDRYPTSRYSLLALNPVTGRRHQLRRHLKHLSHPIIGDAKYGKSLHSRYFQTHFNSTRLLLAATVLECIHPCSGAPLRIYAQPDESFMRVGGLFGYQGEFLMEP